MPPKASSRRTTGRATSPRAAWSISARENGVVSPRVQMALARLWSPTVTYAASIPTTTSSPAGVSPGPQPMSSSGSASGSNEAAIRSTREQQKLWTRGVGSHQRRASIGNAAGTSLETPASASDPAREACRLSRSWPASQAAKARQPAAVACPGCARRPRLRPLAQPLTTPLGNRGPPGRS